MSRSVPSIEVLAVPVCPTVPAKQSFHPLKESIWPLGENALPEEILRWLFDCFLANTVVFLPTALRCRTRTLFSYQGAVDGVPQHTVHCQHGKKKTSIRLSDTAQKLLEQLSERLGISQSAVIEQSIRALAKREGIASLPNQTRNAFHPPHE